MLDEENNTNATLRALAPLYEKYEPCAWWYGVFSIYVRLLETAFLVFIPDPVMKTLFASCVSVISIIVQREVEPWLKDRTDIVANAGLWLVFAWLFALNSYDSLSSLPGAVWGTPLVLVTIAFIAIVIQQGYAERP